MLSVHKYKQLTFSFRRSLRSEFFKTIQEYLEYSDTLNPKYANMRYLQRAYNKIQNLKSYNNSQLQNINIPGMLIETKLCIEFTKCFN